MIHFGNGVVEVVRKQDYHALHHYHFFFLVHLAETKGFMLIGISPLISPDLLAVLHRMGHGDEIVLADAHFPGET